MKIRNITKRIRFKHGIFLIDCVLAILWIGIIPLRHLSKCGLDCAVSMLIMGMLIYGLMVVRSRR